MIWENVKPVDLHIRRYKAWLPIVGASDRATMSTQTDLLVHRRVFILCCTTSPALKRSVVWATVALLLASTRRRRHDVLWYQKHFSSSQTATQSLEIWTQCAVRCPVGHGDIFCFFHLNLWQVSASIQWCYKVITIVPFSFAMYSS